MLNRSTTLKRTGFKSRAPTSISRDPDRVRATPTVTPGAFRVPGPVASAPAARVEKSAPVRSEALRRAVASLPCVICGMPVWAADTRRKLLAMGLWPKALPLQNFSTGEDFELTRKDRT